MEIQHLEPGDIVRLREIDRTEVIRRLYTYKGGGLNQERVVFKVPPWTVEKVEALIADIRPELDGGGVLIGALDGEKLVGVVVLGNRPICNDDAMLQMIFLHVSQNYRRAGTARTLVEEVVKVAKERGASRLYVSATPSDSAIRFYFSVGCKLAPKVDKELYAKEPEDIHLVLDV